MTKDEKGIEIIDPVIPPVAEVADDAEAKIAALEDEKTKILEREANYKAAYLKEKAKHVEPDPNESDDDRVRRITREEMATSRLSQIDTEKEALLKKTLKDNQELKLALKNKTTIPAAIGTHSESRAVSDTLVTPEQIAHFKSLGKDDKWIENYKRNLQKNTR